MKRIKDFNEFNETYFPKWMSDSTKDKKKEQIAKQAAKADDDPSAYKPLPGDTKGKKKLKTSKHTSAYHQKFSKNEEAEGQMYIKALENIITDANRFLEMLDPQAELEAWVQDKITIAEHNMSAIADYMESIKGGPEA